MTMKRLLMILAVLALSSVGAMAQSQEDGISEFERRRKESNEAFKRTKERSVKRFNEEKNREYAQWMKQKWEFFESQEELTPPPSPDPVIPPTVEPETTPMAPPKQVEHENTPIVAAEPAPKPNVEVVPPAVAPMDERQYIYADFYGSEVRVAYTPAMVTHMTDCKEANVSAAWSHLSESSSNLWLKELFELRNELALCDWAYYRLVEKASLALLGEGNDAVLLQVFTLVQSGLKVRMGREDNSLRLLYPSLIDLYGYSYITIEGLKYYVLSKGKVGGVYIYDSIFPGEQLPSSQITIPQLSLNPTEKSYHSSNRYPNVAVTAGTSFNLMDFYNECPRNTSWQYYANANISDNLKAQVYPTLSKEMEGLSDKDAANVLINFVQTGFEYKTDDEHFGYERPLYGDEMFYYNYSDCEDRSILYSILVRDLLGLDVVLLHFKNHLATAVHFNSEVEGDYLMIGGEKYIVCDPTYINATIGMTMPGMEERLENIIVLN